MASTRIPYNLNTAAGKLIAEATNDVVEAAAKMVRIKAILVSASWGDDWAAVATELGITSQQAQDLVYIISTVSDAVNTGTVQQLSKLDQG